MQEGARRSVLVRNTLSTTTVLLAILLDGKADVRTIILARVLQPLYIVHCPRTGCCDDMMICVFDNLYFSISLHMHNVHAH